MMRDDLFGVLGIDTVGELSLPPIGGVGRPPHRRARLLSRRSSSESPWVLAYTASATASGSQESSFSVSSLGLLHVVDSPELLDEPFLPGGSETLDVVEYRLGHSLVPQGAVIRDGEPVALVTDALQRYSASD